MRKIKFRAWDAEDNTMFFVDTLNFDSNGAYIDSVKTYPNSDIEYGWIGSSESLMQYIGLKDKNGREIYEEDIVKFDPSVPPLGVMPQEDEVGIIKYILNSFLVVTKNNVNYDIDELGDWVVIGNIYETPEILKDEK